MTKKRDDVKSGQEAREKLRDQQKRSEEEQPFDLEPDPLVQSFSESMQKDDELPSEKKVKDEIRKQKEARKDDKSTRED